jgi:hypothetical protein
MKKLLFLLLAFSFHISLAYGQACDSSTRTIMLKDKRGQKLTEKAVFELFHLAPKNTGADFNDYDRTAKFMSEFLHGNPDADKSRFWSGYGEGNPFVRAPAEKAKDYIKNYKLEDF